MTAIAKRATDRGRLTSIAGLRHGAVVGAAGLALALAAPTAVAAPNGAEGAFVQNLTAVSSTVVVPADAEWSIEGITVTGEKPAPVAASPSVATSPSSASSSAILSIARRYIGVPYVYGGTTPAGFDCSGFTSYVFAQVGIKLPTSSSAQRYAGTVVPASQARPGDLVWWPGHVGIYTGNGQHIAARQPGTALYEGPILRSNPIYIRVL